MKWKPYIMILVIVLATLTAVSAENSSVKNIHSSNINDTKYINTRDYYFNENGKRITYTSDTGSFNNVTMSNGYNAYAIQDGGYIETNDSKTHPSFWNDTYEITDANDTSTIVGHWHYTHKSPIGEYLKILFYTHYDDLLGLNARNPKIPSSIFVQSYVWDFYRNTYDINKLIFKYNRKSVELYNSGFPINNSGNIKWINETHYRVFDFQAFRNTNPSHKDLWVLKVELFKKTEEISMSNTSIPHKNNDTSTLENNTQSNIKTNKTNVHSANEKQTTDYHSAVNANVDDNVKNSSKGNLILKKTGNPTDFLTKIALLICGIAIGFYIKRELE